MVSNFLPLEVFCTDLRNLKGHSHKMVSIANVYQNMLVLLAQTKDYKHLFYVFKASTLSRPAGRPRRGGAAGAAGRVNAGLEAAGGNRIRPVSCLEPEEVAAPGQHVAIAADQDRFRTQKVDKQVLRGLLRPCRVVPGGNDFGSTHSFWKILKKLIFI
jgi:hypothetical protein